uniref:HIT domain-containing protein n=1 Tax=Panagrellus redivivus TaxID=6233 RepID=A0A7E4ZW10_PANRE
MDTCLTINDNKSVITKNWCEGAGDESMTVRTVGLLPGWQYRKFSYLPCQSSINKCTKHLYNNCDAVTRSKYILSAFKIAVHGKQARMLLRSKTADTIEIAICEVEEDIRFREATESMDKLTLNSIQDEDQVGVMATLIEKAVNRIHMATQTNDPRNLHFAYLNPHVHLHVHLPVLKLKTVFKV